MSLLTTDSVPHPAPLWFLTPLPPPLPHSHFSEEQADSLAVLAAITGAPSAIPVPLWETPLHSLALAEVQPLLKSLCTSLSTTIPLMPPSLWEMEDIRDVLHYFHHIPVFPIGIDSCNGDVVGFGSVMCWIGALVGLSTDALDFPLPTEAPPGFEITDLAPVLAKEHAGHPLSGLADVVEVLLQDTGTFFFDACPSCWHSFTEDVTTWTDENIAWLQEDALKAQALQARIDALEAWVAADPQRIDAVWQALLDAYTTYEAALEELRQGFRPKTLVELWGGIQDDGEPEISIEGVTP